MPAMPTDQLQRFLFDDTQVRGEIAQLESTYQDAIASHDYPPAVERLLGELLAACALLTATIKFDGTLSIEIRGQGALKLLMAESNPGVGERAQRLRGVARVDEQAIADMPEHSLETLTGGGHVVITLDPEEGQRYQGIVALDQPSIAGCLEQYFAQSEQLPTRLWLATDEARAAADADALRADMKAVFGQFITANRNVNGCSWVMDGSTALAISLMTNSLGQSEFPGIGMNGGTLGGLPVVVSEYVTAGDIYLVDADNIYWATDGGIELSMSDQASIEMNDSPDGTGSLVSLWQNNLSAFRVEQRLNWMPRRANSVARITGAAYGEAAA